MNGAADGLIDALPYVDLQIDEDGVRDSVEKLIEDELSTFQFEDNGRLPTLKLAAEAKDAEDAPLWRTALADIKQGDEKLNALDLTRYRVPTVPEDGSGASAEEWQKLRQVTELQLQYQHQRVCNLELLQKYGANAWRMHNFQVEGELNAVKQELEREKASVVACNQERKAMQVDAGTKLARLEAQWYELVAKNAQLEVACVGLENQIKEWKQYAEDMEKYQRTHFENTTDAA
ncbi:Pre-mRNA-splicing factor SPF27 [Thamnocephalis sphaerospora]|uniref:Pre-mRNA-splicing factor SPF27 n=1 Tax=Thamnocephalis sphaerospora TaxID=78915 RepID=A0A4P9XQS5_9FUNG|nr:Pre-mRNA-splicing factor SPF27 [Thamnocephalis sphaerospora]|eukprot:RKP08272.1 Pre-mRNA-splicing factor SPF27 [Thamnocephalis sphaerospora]